MLMSHGPLDWLQSAPAGLALCRTSGPPTPLGTSEFAEKLLGLWQANVQVLLPASHLAGEKWSFSPAVSEEYKQPPVSKPRDSEIASGAGFIPEVFSSHHGYHP